MMANLNNAVTALGGGLAELNQQVLANRRAANQVTAIALAMPSAQMPSAPGRTTMTFSSGFYGGETAFAGAFMHRLDAPIPLSIGAGVSIGVRSSVGVRGEVTTEF
jgi:hypothetical protein